MLLNQILYGLLAVVLGTLVLKYHYQIINNFAGRLEWIESKLGAGSTYLMYKLFALLLILGGIITIAGFGDDLANWALAPLRDIFQVK